MCPHCTGAGERRGCTQPICWACRAALGLRQQRRAPAVAGAKHEQRTHTPAAAPGRGRATCAIRHGCRLPLAGGTGGAAAYQWTAARLHWWAKLWLHLIGSCRSHAESKRLFEDNSLPQWVAANGCTWVQYSLQSCLGKWLWRDQNVRYSELVAGSERRHCLGCFNPLPLPPDLIQLADVASKPGASHKQVPSPFPWAQSDPVCCLG